MPEATGSTVKPHPLKDKWRVYYNTPPKKGEGFTDKDLHDLDDVESIEDVFGTMNSFPNVTLLPENCYIIFAREGKKPRFEDFPHGQRFNIFLRTVEQSDAVVPRVLAAVLGEHLTTVCEGNSVADVVRLAHKPGAAFKESVKLEVWTRESKYREQVGQYFEKLVKPYPGVTIVAADLK